ncbi:MAG: hypothetical protein IJR41_01820, partial [Atopobiaceae bacterium]|nr:hypothetical protein [Atopobiaceae bacterium]
PTCRSMVMQYVNLQLADNVKARQLTSDGAWVPVEAPEGEAPFNSQEVLLAYAYRRSRFGAAADEITAPISGAISPIPAETYEALLSLPQIGSYDADPEVTGAMRPIPEPVAVVEDAPAPEPASEPEPVDEPAPEPVRKSRFAAAFELFGKGFRTLFSGSDE